MDSDWKTAEERRQEEMRPPDYMEEVVNRFGHTGPPTNSMSRRLPNELRTLLSNRFQRSPQQGVEQEHDSLLFESIRSNNSQGYMHFYDEQYFNRHRPLYRRIYHVQESVFSIPRRMSALFCRVGAASPERAGGGDTLFTEHPRVLLANEFNMDDYVSNPRPTRSPSHESSFSSGGRRMTGDGGESGGGGGGPGPDGQGPGGPGSTSSSASFYRSEEMLKCQMIMVKDAAYACVAEIGKGGNCQFDDLHAHKSPFQRTFVRDVRRCEELERSLRFLEREIRQSSPPIDLVPIDTTNIEIPSINEINEIEASLVELERSVRELNTNDERMKQSLNEFVEIEHVLEKVETFFQIHLESEALNELADAEAAMMEEELESAAPLSASFRSKGSRGFPFVADDAPPQLIPLTRRDESFSTTHTPWFMTGVIPVEKKVSFERVLWRACRRTAFVRLAEIEDDFLDPITLIKTRKCVFIVFFKGESLKNIIEKVCTGYNACRYPCPKTSIERREARTTTLARISDLTTIIQTTQSHRHQLLCDTALKLPGWLKKLHVHKGIYQTLNRLTVDTNGFLAGEAWIPRNEINNVKKAMDTAVEQTGTSLVRPIINVLQEVRSVPPTFHRVNKFTRVFQDIVDSYGVATYREVNPAPFTIITFPFLFAVMFGDIAHGAILLAAALTFILNENKIHKAHIRDEIFNAFFGGRYIMMLMGLFSIYTGVIYNDAFGKAFNLFGSRWSNPYNQTQLLKWANAAAKTGRRYYVNLDPLVAYDRESGPYPLGLDPIWNVAENRLSFINSMKMKASVIIGICHMTFGLFLSLKNHRFNRSRMDILFNFIPQILFMTCIFAYLCVQIFAKWIFIPAGEQDVFGFKYPGSYCAPSLLIGLINMFMRKSRPYGFVDDKGKEMNNCFLNFWFPHQRAVERILVWVAILCVPVMLGGKPLMLWLARKKSHGKGGGGGGGKDGSSQRDDEGLLVQDEPVATTPVTPTMPSPTAAPAPTQSVHEAEHSFSDVVVHQAIHTIEFVLGCVSHTASYLRLWALSLAHAQLSEVLWHMLLAPSLGFSDAPLLGSVIVFVAFFVFAVLTVSILVVMEGLSAFLHALRLHWVEFQSKFYMGGGHPFQPFSLVACLEKAQQQSEVLDVE